MKPTLHHIPLAVPLAALLLLPAPRATAGQASGGPAGWVADRDWYVAASWTGARLPLPEPCVRSELQTANVFGVNGHASAVRFDGLVISVSVSALTENVDMACAPIVRPNGLHRVVTYRGEPDGGWSPAVQAILGYELPDTPQVRFTAGAGWLGVSRAPYGTAGAGLRVGGRVRFLLEAALHLLATPYEVFDEEWTEGEMTNRLRAGAGRAWEFGPELRLGVETRIR
jgi:hypothetical protein